MGPKAYAVRFWGLSACMYHFHFPEVLQTIAVLLLCRQEISSKAIQIDFAANHPESGWLAEKFGKNHAIEIAHEELLL